MSSVEVEISQASHNSCYTDSTLEVADIQLEPTNSGDVAVQERSAV